MNATAGPATVDSWAAIGPFIRECCLHVGDLHHGWQIWWATPLSMAVGVLLMTNQMTRLNSQFQFLTDFVTSAERMLQ